MTVKLIQTKTGEAKTFPVLVAENILRIDSRMSNKNFELPKDSDYKFENNSLRKKPKKKPKKED